MDLLPFHYFIIESCGAGSLLSPLKVVFVAGMRNHMANLSKENICSGCALSLARNWVNWLGRHGGRHSRAALRGWGAQDRNLKVLAQDPFSVGIPTQYKERLVLDFRRLERPKNKPTFSHTDPHPAFKLIPTTNER